MGREFLHIPDSAGGSSGALIKHTHFKANNRIQLGQHNRRKYACVDFTKEKGADESYLLVYGICPAIGMINWPNIGLYLTVYPTNNYSSSTANGMTSATDWGYGGISYGGSGGNQDREAGLHLFEKTFVSNNAPADKMTFLERNVPASHLPAGSMKLEWGHISSSGCQTFKYINPNSSNDNRAHQQGTFFSIMEFSF